MSAHVEVVPYRAEWAPLFLEEEHVLRSVLSPWLAGEIEHIGSTAVFGLHAKPVIDIMAPVASLPRSKAAITGAESVGYVYYPYRAEVMHWFCKPSPLVRTHHLHLVPRNSPLWRERIAFRDALRGSEALRDEYAKLKLSLAERFASDREAYTEAKGPFVQRVLSACAVRGQDAT